MVISSERLAYSGTGFFSKLVSDFLEQVPHLAELQSFPSNIEGIEKSIQARLDFNTDRALLSKVLLRQYNGTQSAEQAANLKLLLERNTFTITTAHQPNILTGPLYFIYKILHAIKLAEHCKQQFPDKNFVPIFYIGSEDADLDELNHFTVDGKKYVWDTKQTGAVGRMLIDEAFAKLIDELSGQLSVKQFGAELIAQLKLHYAKGKTVGAATFSFVNSLFASLGLIVIDPDDAELKQVFVPVVKKELTELFSAPQVTAQAAVLQQNYKVQASGRDINLFYLKDDFRERIEVGADSNYIVNNTTLSFSQAEILQEVNDYPDRFSGNVILRPVFQETILPNVAFIGGGGEVAYWLELKRVFEAVNVPYPVLVLRNSFLLAQESDLKKFEVAGFNRQDIFQDKLSLLNGFVKKNNLDSISLTPEKDVLITTYAKIKQAALAVDKGLEKHTDALQHKALKKIEALEKKLLKAERQKLTTQSAQIDNIKTKYFPNNNLQERVESMLGFYAALGPDFMKQLFTHSLSLEQQFTLLSFS